MSLRMELYCNYDQVAATKYSTLNRIAKSIAQDTARYRKLSPSILMVSSKSSGILKTTRVDFDVLLNFCRHQSHTAQLLQLIVCTIVPLTIIAIQNDAFQA